MSNSKNNHYSSPQNKKWVNVLRTELHQTMQYEEGKIELKPKRDLLAPL